MSLFCSPCGSILFSRSLPYLPMVKVSFNRVLDLHVNAGSDHHKNSLSLLSCANSNLLLNYQLNPNVTFV